MLYLNIRTCINETSSINFAKSFESCGKDDASLRTQDRGTFKDISKI